MFTLILINATYICNDVFFMRHAFKTISVMRPDHDAKTYQTQHLYIISAILS